MLEDEIVTKNSELNDKCWARQKETLAVFLVPSISTSIERPCAELLKIAKLKVENTRPYVYRVVGVRWTY